MSDDQSVTSEKVCIGSIEEVPTKFGWRKHWRIGDPSKKWQGAFFKEEKLAGSFGLWLYGKNGVLDAKLKGNEL